MDVKRGNCLALVAGVEVKGGRLLRAGQDSGVFRCTQLSDVLWTRHSVDSSKQMGSVTFKPFASMSHRLLMFLVNHLCLCFSDWTVCHLYSNMIRQSNRYKNLNMTQKHGNSSINVSKRKWELMPNNFGL